MKVRAERSDKADGEVIEEALRRDLGLDVLDRLWARNALSEDEAVKLASKPSTRLDSARTEVWTVLDPNVIMSAPLEDIP